MTHSGGASWIAGPWESVSASGDHLLRSCSSPALPRPLLLSWGAAASWLRRCWPEPFLEATSLPSGLHCPRPQPLKPSLMGAQRPRRSTPPQDCPLGQFKTRPLEKSGRWDLPGGPVVKTSPSSAGAVVQSESRDPTRLKA